MGDDLGRGGLADRGLGSRRPSSVMLLITAAGSTLIEGRDEDRRRIDGRVLRRERQHLRRWSPERPVDRGRQLVPGLRRGARRNLDAVAGCHREAIDRAGELEAQGAGADPAPPSVQRGRDLHRNVGLVELRQRRERNHRLVERHAQVGRDVDVTDWLVAQHLQRSVVGRLRLRFRCAAERLVDRGADARPRQRFRRTVERNRSAVVPERRQPIDHRGDRRVGRACRPAPPRPP